MCKEIEEIINILKEADKDCGCTVFDFCEYYGSAIFMTIERSKE